MRTQLPVKLLWLTDLHFSQHYETFGGRESYDVYFQVFLDTVARTHTLEYPIDYILLTGDLAQSGSKEDYECFWNLFLKPLLDFFLDDMNPSLPLVITIPGNHDVNWKREEFLEEYLEKIKIDKKKYPERKQFLKENETRFNSLFEDYTTFINERISVEGGKYSRFFNVSPDNNRELLFIVSNSYAENKLFGYVVDIKKQLVLVLLNSAWYSLGDRFDLQLANKIIKDPAFEKSAEFIQQKLKEKEFITEYSSQLSGIHLLEVEQLSKELEDYQDFTIVTCMHHSINWLAWEEYYTYSGATKENANMLRWLLDKTDVFLTGHEHVPISVQSDNLNSNTIHLKGGSFMFHTSPEKDFLFDNTWFSVLGIDPAEGILTQWRFSVADTAERPGNKKLTDLIKRHNKYILTPMRESRIIEGPKSINYDVNKFTLYLKGQGIIDDSSIFLVEIKSPLPVFKTFRTTGTFTDVFLLAIDTFSYDDLGESFYDWVIKLASSGEYNCKVIRFVVPDIFVKLDNSEKPYGKKLWTRESILRQIVQKSDSGFNKFRSAFFIRKSELAPLDSYQNLCFANHILPYWVYEKIWL